MRKLKGKDIVSIVPVAGNYGHGYLMVFDKDNGQYRVHASELLPLVQGATFEVEMKRKYNHLTLCKS